MAALTNIAIIGGGLAGTSLAMAFAERGICCTAFESSAFGSSGASAISRGIVRVFDYHPWLTKQGLSGLRRWQSLALRFPGVFTNCGALYLVSSEQRDQVKQRLSELREHRYTFHLLTNVQEITNRFPLLKGRELEQDQWAIWEPEGGYVNTRLSCQLFAEQARTKGAVMLEGVTVSDINNNGQYVDVVTHQNLTRFDAVILATGARLSELASQHDVFCRSIPISLLQSTAGTGVPHCLIDETLGGYIRPDQMSYFFAGGAQQTDTVHPDSLPTSQQIMKRENEAIASKILSLDSLSTTSNLMGYDGYRQDFLPLIKLISKTERIGFFTAFSGRGAKYIPHIAYNYVSNFIAKNMKEVGIA